MQKERRHFRRQYFWGIVEEGRPSQGRGSPYPRPQGKKSNEPKRRRDSCFYWWAPFEIGKRTTIERRKTIVFPQKSAAETQERKTEQKRTGRVQPIPKEGSFSLRSLKKGS